MPRTRRSHRGETTKELEVHVADDSQEMLFEEYLLRRAARARADAERQITEAITLALSSGLSWIRIGRLLGMPVQEAQAKHGQIARRAS